MLMDIPGLSVHMAQNKFLSNVGTAVLAQSLDMAKTTGDAIVNMIDSAAMERSVRPELGGNIDVSV